MDFYKFKCFEKYSYLIHAVTNRSMNFPYDFSMALHTGENKNKIIGNRKIIASHLKSDENLHFIVANQTHSDHIKIITKKEAKGWESLEDAVEDCDALITNVKGIVLTILTADCVPVLLYDNEKKVVAAVHAGWKGTKANIVAKTVLKMKEIYACNPENIVAAVAPSIGSCCYEVGEDVAKYFFDILKGVTKREDKYMLDLPYINKYQLLESGLKEEHIEMSNVCTACDFERYFSYRKEKGCSGRFMSIIGMLDK
jgi:YfiH family protein